MHCISNPHRTNSGNLVIRLQLDEAILGITGCDQTRCTVMIFYVCCTLLHQESEGDASEAQSEQYMRSNQP